MKTRYDVDVWRNGNISSMRFEDLKEAFELAKECAQQTTTWLTKLVFNAEGRLIGTSSVKMNADGTWVKAE